MYFKFVLFIVVLGLGQTKLIAQNTKTTTRTTTVTRSTTTNSNGKSESTSTTTKRVNGRIVQVNKNGQVVYSDRDGNGQFDKLQQQGTTNGEKVLICFGPEAYAYHKYYCNGVLNCSEKIDTVSLLNAKKINRTACEICY